MALAVEVVKFHVDALLDHETLEMSNFVTSTIVDWSASLPIDWLESNLAVPSMGIEMAVEDVGVTVAIDRFDATSSETAIAIESGFYLDTQNPHFLLAPDDGSAFTLQFRGIPSNETLLSSLVGKIHLDLDIPEGFFGGSSGENRRNLREDDDDEARPRVNVEARSDEVSFMSGLQVWDVETMLPDAAADIDFNFSMHGFPLAMTNAQGAQLGSAEVEPFRVSSNHLTPSTSDHLNFGFEFLVGSQFADDVVETVSGIRSSGRESILIASQDTDAMDFKIACEFAPAATRSRGRALADDVEADETPFVEYIRNVTIDILEINQVQIGDSLPTIEVACILDGSCNGPQGTFDIGMSIFTGHLDFLPVDISMAFPAIGVDFFAGDSDVSVGSFTTVPFAAPDARRGTHFSFTSQVDIFEAVQAVQDLTTVTAAVSEGSDVLQDILSRSDVAYTLDMSTKDVSSESRRSLAEEAGSLPSPVSLFDFKMSSSQLRVTEAFTIGFDAEEGLMPNFFAPAFELDVLDGAVFELDGECGHCHVAELEMGGITVLDSDGLFSFAMSLFSKNKGENVQAVVDQVDAAQELTLCFTPPNDRRKEEAICIKLPSIDFFGEEEQRRELSVQPTIVTLDDIAMALNHSYVYAENVVEVQGVDLLKFESEVSIVKPSFDFDRSEVFVALLTYGRSAVDGTSFAVDLPDFGMTVALDETDVVALHFGPECEDTKDFLDVLGFNCSTWVDVSCEDQRFGYSSKQIEDVVQNCRHSCNLCGRIDVNTGAPENAGYFEVDSQVTLFDAMALLEKMEDMQDTNVAVQVRGIGSNSEKDLMSNLMYRFNIGFEMDLHSDEEPLARQRQLLEEGSEALSRFVLTTSDAEFRVEETVDGIDALFGDDLPIKFPFNMEGCELDFTNFDGETVMSGEMSTVSLFSDEGSGPVGFALWVDQAMSDSMVDMGKNIRDNVKAEEGLKVRGNFTNGGGISVVVSVKSAPRRSLQESSGSGGLDPSEFVEGLDLSRFYFGENGDDEVLDLHCILDPDCDESDVVVNLDGSVYMKALDDLPLRFEVTVPAFKLGVRGATEATVAETPNGEYTYFAGFESSPLEFVSDEASTLEYSVFLDLARSWKSVFKTNEEECVNAMIVAEMDRSQDLLHSMLSQMGVSFSIDLDDPDTTAAIGDGSNSDEEESPPPVSESEASAASSTGESEDASESTGGGLDNMAGAIFFGTTRQQILTRIETAFDLVLDDGINMPVFHVEKWGLAILNMRAKQEDETETFACTSGVVHCEIGRLSMATLDVSSVETTHFALNMSLAATDDGAMLGDMMSNFADDQILELRLLREFVAEGDSGRVASIVLPTKGQLGSLESTWHSCMSGSDVNVGDETGSSRRRTGESEEELAIGLRMTDVALDAKMDMDDPLGSEIDFSSSWLTYGQVLLNNFEVVVSTPAYGFEVVLTEVDARVVPLSSSLSMEFGAMEIDTVSSDGSFSLAHSISATDALAAVELTGSDFVVAVTGMSRETDDLLSNIIGHLSVQFEVAVNSTAAAEVEEDDTGTDAMGRRLTEARDTAFVNFALDSDDGKIAFDLEVWGMEEMLQDTYFGVDLTMFVGSMALDLVDATDVSGQVFHGVFDGLNVQLLEDTIEYHRNFGIHLHFDESMVNNAVAMKADVNSGTDVQLSGSSAIGGVTDGNCTIDILLKSSESSSASRQLAVRENQGGRSRRLMVDEEGFFELLFLESFSLGDNAPNRTIDLQCLTDLDCDVNQGYIGFDGGFKLREFELSDVAIGVTLPAMHMNMSTIVDGVHRYLGEMKMDSVNVENATDFHMHMDMMQFRHAGENMLDADAEAGQAVVSFYPANLLHIALGKLLGDFSMGLPSFSGGGDEDDLARRNVQEGVLRRRRVQEASAIDDGTRILSFFVFPCILSTPWFQPPPFPPLLSLSLSTHTLLPYPRRPPPLPPSSSSVQHSRRLYV
jgi:hypothetical protein